MKLVTMEYVWATTYSAAYVTEIKASTQFFNKTLGAGLDDEALRVSAVEVAIRAADLAVADLYRWKREN